GLDDCAQLARRLVEASRLDMLLCLQQTSLHRVRRAFELACEPLERRLRLGRLVAGSTVINEQNGGLLCELRRVSLPITPPGDDRETELDAAQQPAPVVAPPVAQRFFQFAIGKIIVDHGTLVATK